MSWKDIVDFPGYQANGDTGEIRSFVKNPDRPRVLRQTKVGKKGHRRVFLYRDRIRFPQLVHRLVAQTFVPNPNNYPIVRHRDDNPAHNYASNLVWGTQLDNMHDCMANGRLNYDGLLRYNEKRGTPILARNIHTDDVLLFNTQSEAARELNNSQGNIWRSLQKHTPTKGYIFEYLKKGSETDGGY